MKPDSGKRALPFLFVAALALGLHFTFSQLSGEITTLFPYLASEQRAPTPPTPAAPEVVKNEPVAEPAPVSSESGAPTTALEELRERNDFKKPEAPRERNRILGWVRVSPLPIPVATEAHQDGERPFAVTPELEPAVEFWQKIYAVYDTKQVVFHDEEDLGIQYGVLDLHQVLDNLASDAEKKSYREAAVRQEMERIKGLLTDPAARERVRSQVGLKDRFAEGLINSGRYLPHFEQIFASYGIPREISRLPFVESLFKERAYSKVGAAGLWQFMAGTARQHGMVVDSLVDERYDPIRSAHAAAHLLLKNHNLLKSWPLAINAYNSGSGNLLRGIFQCGTRDIATIIRNHHGGGYGFASRNFYPEFLAALGVYENRQRFFGNVKLHDPWEFDVIQLPGTMTLPEVAFLANMTLAEVRDLNPAFTEEAYSGRHALPGGAELRIPPQRQKLFASRFLQFYNAGSVPRLHIVAAGESASEIAHQYGLASDDITSLNHKRSFQEGEVVLLPSVKTVASDDHPVSNF